MKIVYDAALFEGTGGGPLHFTGISGALSVAGGHVVHVLPARSSVAVERLTGDVVRLPVIGNKVIRQFVYDLSRCGLILYWWVTRRRFDVWIVRQSAFAVFVVMARLVARRVILEVNGALREEILLNFDSRPAALFADWCFKRQIAGAHVVVAVTEGLADYTRQRNRRTPVHVVANGALPFAPDSEARRIRDVTLTFAGALAPWYDLNTPLRAIAALRSAGTDLDLVVLGDGVRAQEFQDLVIELEIADLVDFRGWVSHREARNMMLRAQVGLLPQNAHGDLKALGSPLKLFEYAAAGLRVVGTDLDGVSNSPVRAIVHPYPPGDVGRCAAAILDALNAGRTQVSEDCWSWDARATQLIDIARGNVSAGATA